MEFKISTMSDEICIENLISENVTDIYSSIDDQDCINNFDLSLLDTFEFKNKPSKYFKYEFPGNLEKATSYLKASNDAVPSINFVTSNVEASQIYLHINLYERRNDKIQFSPHLIARNKKELSAEPIFEMMSLVPGKVDNTKTFEFNFQKFYIIQTTKKNMQTSYNEKLAAFNKKVPSATSHQPTIYESENSDAGLMLGCQVFQLVENHFQPFTERIYSDVMYPENLLNISIKQLRFEFSGGENINLKIDKHISIENFQVLISCSEIKGKHAAWQEICSLRTEQGMFCIETPKCNAEIIDSKIAEITCNLRLITKENIFCSKPYKIIYKLPEMPRRARKQSAQVFEEPIKPKRSYYTDSSPIGNSVRNPFDDVCVTPMEEIKSPLDTAIKRLKHLVQQQQQQEATIEIDRFIELNDAYALQNAEENSIIHDAIAKNKYLHVYDILKGSHFMGEVPSLRNKCGETPLHYACKLGKCKLVLSLCNKFYPLYLQDDQQNTPLHVAINEGSSCLIEFQTLISDEHFDSDELKAAMHWSLQVYDENGLTFLHLAVLKQLFQFIESILIYCQRHNIDACEIGTLKTGDTILHLAKQSEIIDLILKYNPNAVHYTNYAGKYALEKVDDDFTDLLKDFENMHTS